MRRKTKIVVNIAGDMAIIEVLDDLTSSAEDAMNKAYQEACAQSPATILFKFHSERRINSGGAAILISLLTQSQKSGQKVFITGISEHLKEIFKLIGLDKYATIVDSEESARNG